jgi:hypothetical protein
MRRYDDVRRKYRHDDASRSEGLEIIKRIVPDLDLEAAKFRLSLYAGGAGVSDSIAIAVPVDESKIDSAVSLLSMRTPAEAMADPNWAEEFEWLVENEEQPLPVGEAAARFINEERAPEFQCPCSPADPLWFEDSSGVNHWVAMWFKNGVLNYLAFDVG